MGVFKKIFFSKFTLTLYSIALIINTAFGLESEFKNSLSKIELKKNSQNSYSVNLYTQNKFSQEPKIIKKSDLNYYILLPETKNVSSSVSYSNTDIRSVTTNSYPYAGQDINNGYTKININTTRPINFNIEIKNEAVAKKQTQALAKAQEEKVEKKEEAVKTKTEKKNSYSSKTNISIEKKSSIKTPKIEKAQNKVVEKKVKTTKKSLDNKQNKKPKTIETMVAKEVENAKKEAQNTNIDEPLQEKEVIEDIPLDNNLLDNDLSDSENKGDLKEDEDFASILNEAQKIAQAHNTSKKSIIEKIETKLKFYFKKVKNKFKEYGVGFYDLMLMLIAGVVSFVVMLLILNSKTNSGAKLKSKKDLLDKTENALNPKQKQTQQVQKPKNDGQYFIFDKNIKQTGFCDPATSAIKRNYELSSYDPELRDNYNKGEQITPDKKTYSKSAQENEYDIIQKILKEDSFIEIAPGEFEAVSKIQTESSKKEIKNVSSPIKQQAKREEKKIEKEVLEPIVLSKVEIAPERGFMCVSYNDNISFMGYIFDDVFALYNFKQPKLENYDIKFRLSEKDDKAADFIVKVDKIKMLIRVTKSSMGLEVVL